MAETREPDVKQPWDTPELRKFRLTAEEVTKLRASDDPMALLLEMKPELARKASR